MTTRNQAITSRVVSARVPENIYLAYDQIQNLYGIKQSELIRMAPLLLILIAEGSLASRWRKVQNEEVLLRRSQEIDWQKFREVDRERVAIKNREVFGKGFIEYLRDLTKNIHNEDVINREDIEEGKGGFPEYSIFETQLLRLAAHEIAEVVREYEIENLLSQDADNRYDGQLLAVSSKKLGGKLLNDDQKSKVRQHFKDALRVQQAASTFNDSDIKDNTLADLHEIAYQVVRDRVPPEDISSLLNQQEIPRRYDAQLLAISRKKLGKPLNSREKSAVRKQFRVVLNDLKGIHFSRHERNST